MSEKKGKPAKLIYPFPTQRCLEIKHYNTGQWYRVTPREFRSYKGERRILQFDETNTPYYEDYSGPVYYFESNIVYKENTPGFIYLHNIDPRPSRKTIYSNR
jgi:hypothetical protein